MHSIHTWEEMVSKFLSKYYPYARALQLRKEILNFQQLPTESVYEAWERFKSCLRKCPDHRILLLDQILTFYNEITRNNQERFMVAAGGNFMWKTPQEAYDLIENMTQHHFQWDTELYYNTTTDISSHYSETTFASRERVEVLGKQTGYTIQSVQHNPGPSHPNIFYYSDFDESDDDEPSEMIKDQKSIHHLSGSPTPSSDHVVASFSPSLTPTRDKKSSGSITTYSDYSLLDYEAFYFDDDHIKEKSSGSTTTHSDFSLLEYDSFIFDLSIDPFPSADRSVSHHEEFTDELAHIISPPEYDRFYFDLEIVLGEFTRVLKENIFDLSTKGLTINELNDSSLLLSYCDSPLSKEFFEIDLLVLFPSRNEDIIFNPGIFIIKRVQSKRF
ncbi:reverse transcriptase domain-containing protein [Tanacetum coccineum]